MRCPPPGDLTSDQALTELRRRLTNPDEHEARRAGYAHAIRTVDLDAVLRLADAEQADLRKVIELLRDLADVWATVDPNGLMSRVRAAETLRQVIGE